MSRFDDAIHTFTDGLRYAQYWRAFPYESEFVWYYAEDELYVIRNKRKGTCAFIYASAPDEALEIFMSWERK